MSSKKIIELSTSEGYNRWASIYETNKNPLTALDGEAFQANFEPVKPGERIIDLGCGTGRITSRLIAQGAEVTGIDGSEEMLAIAREKCSGKAEFVLHDMATPLPYEADHFDKAISTLVLEHIADLGFFFSEIARVCRQDGSVYITAMHPAMMLKGNRANFTDPETGDEVRPMGYPHQLSDFIMNMTRAGLALANMKEYSGTKELASRFPKANKYLDWPMLICFNLRNNKGGG